MESGYFFAMSGSNFGIVHREKSKREIRSLSVTAQGTVTATVVLNGQSTSFSIAGGASANQTSYLISQHDFSQVGSGWSAESIDGTVYFISDMPGPFGGAFDITVGGVSIVTSNTRVQAGVLPSDTFISQSLWNIDTMDGGGPSRMVLDRTKGNVYGIGYQFLGFGAPTFSVENSETGFLVDVHRIQTANARTELVVRNPQMTAQWDAINSGSSAGSVTIKGGSAAVFNEGLVRRDVGISFSASGSVSGIGVTPVPVITLRANKVFGSQCCYGELNVFNVSVGCLTGNSATNKILKVLVYKNAQLGGPVNFQHVDASRSVSAVDVGATSLSINAGSRLLKSFVVAANTSTTLNVDAENFYLANGETITVAVGWFEDQ
jgi:hypothetical protein